MLVFDNGYFSEFGTFSISDWVGHTPAEVLAKNFGVPAATFANFPKEEVYIAKGPVPPPLPPIRRRARSSSARSPTAIACSPQAPDIFAGGTMRIVSMNEFPISTTMTGALFVIKPGAMRELHWHPNAAEWQYYLKGTGRMTVFGSQAAPAPTISAPATSATCRRATATTSRTPANDLEILLVLNSGVYQSISITAWMAATPDLLATNFGVPESIFANLPSGEVVMPEEK